MLILRRTKSNIARNQSPIWEQLKQKLAFEAIHQLWSTSINYFIANLKELKPL